MAQIEDKTNSNFDKANTLDGKSTMTDTQSSHASPTSVSPPNTAGDQSTRVMPKALVLVAALFLIARIADIGFQIARNATPQPVQQSVQWHELPEISAGAFTTKQEFVPPPVLDVSPETMKEIDKVLAMSSAQNKYVLYEFYAPWSDPCKKMETTSLTNAQVSSLIDQHFMPFRVTDRLKQLGKNPRLVTDLQKKFRIFAFPTLVIVDEKGETAATLVGNCSSLTTYRFLSRAVHSLEQKSRANQTHKIGTASSGMRGIVSTTTPPAYPTLAVKSPKG